MDYDKYPIIGKGAYGTVYLLPDNTCLKVNRNAANNQKEIELYQKYSESPLFPKIFETARNYIIMEYIQGLSLREYMEAGNGFNEEIILALISMFEEGKKIELDLNPNARHILLTPDGIRLLDLDDIVKFAYKTPYMLLHWLDQFKLRRKFLKFVKNNNRTLFDYWNLKLIHPKKKKQE